MSKVNKLLLILFFVVLGVLVPPRLFAQEDESPYEIAYQEYLDQTSTYQTVHQEYILRKSQYESFKTLQAQQDAQAATVKMLQERDEVVLSYLSALKEKVTENPGLSDIEKDALKVQIDTEITWFTDHKNNIPTAGSLDDLAKDSKLALAEYDKAQLLFYKSLSSISSGKLTDVVSRFNDKFSELKSKVSEISAETREEYAFSSDKLQRLDRWIFDAESRIDRAYAKHSDANDVINALGSGNRSVKNLPSAYDSVLTNLSLSQQYMKVAGGFLQEIVRDIKTAEE